MPQITSGYSLLVSDCRITFVSHLFVFDRKGTMLLNNILIAIGGGLIVTSKFVKSYEVLIAGRLVIGFSCGKFTFYMIFLGTSTVKPLLHHYY